MFKFICVLAFASAACAASIGSSLESTTEKREVIPVINFETDKKPDGSFRFTFEGGDKSFREESGVLENAGTDDEALEVSGSYRYIDADGREIEVHYTAGRNGFVPVGTNILSEITAVARAAGDLPDTTVEEETRRRARSKVEKDGEEKIEKVKKSEKVRKAEKTEKAEKEVAEQKKKAEEKKVEEKKVEEKKVEEKKPEEKKPEEKKPEEKKPEEKKPAAKA